MANNSETRAYQINHPSLGNSFAEEVTDESVKYYWEHPASGDLVIGTYNRRTTVMSWSREPMPRSMR